MRIIFLGTPEFAVPTLEAVLAAGHQVALVVTQPDRPKGRKQELIPSPVKAAAQRHEIPVYQPEKIRAAESLTHLAAQNPQAMVVVGYGQIIPQSIIDLAPLGIVNVHASLLPELRGAAPSSGPSRAASNGPASPPCASMLASIPATFCCNGRPRSAPTRPLPNSPPASPQPEPISSSEPLLKRFSP